MNDARVPEVLDNNDQRVKDLEALEKELDEFLEGLPYDQARVIEKTQDSLKKTVMGIFRAGCGMILLKAHEGETYPPILEKYFPGVTLDTAKRWRKFARKMAPHPQFKAFISERGGYSIGLTLLESCTSEEIEGFEETGEIRGFTKDMIDNMSVRQLKRALRLAKEKAAKAVDKAVEKLNKENAELKDEVDTLKAALSDEDIEAAKKLMDKAGKKLTDAIDLLRQLPRELLARDGFMRQAAFAVLAEVKGSAEYLEMEIAELANPDPGETVRKHMARLRGQAEAQGAEHSES